MMALETELGSDGLRYRIPSGTPDEMAALRESFGHLTRLRDEVIQMGILPQLEQWSKVNSNL
jgi:malate dehydrogenase